MNSALNPETLLQLLLTLAVVPPQQTGQLERLAAGLAGVEVGQGVAEVAARPHVDSVDLRWVFRDGRRFWQLEDVWEV
ncbi:hypothetical protein EYF80_020302 [Liparis tanakae]|uniref:Uncharacterized protein n=1 Tax=Liparis tanakae TaxID=230148 RepID=A0A4Z2HUX6_9TELE|nr:hypothetical protein EYF80_020302 [Liparis tanakae]